MSTHTAERRPLGALGRMGVVAALHVGLLYMIANSLGHGAIDPGKQDRGHDHRRGAAARRSATAARTVTSRRGATPWCSLTTASGPRVRTDGRHHGPAARCRRPPGADGRKRRRAAAHRRRASGLALPAVSAAVSAQRNPRGQHGHRRHRGLRDCRTAASATRASSRARDSRRWISRRWMRRSANGA